MPFSVSFVRQVETKAYCKMVDLRILGGRLRQIRKKHGLTQKNLAQLTNTTQTAVSRLENGEEVNASMLVALLMYFHERYSLDNLFSEDFDINSYRQPPLNREEIRHQLEQLLHLL